MTTLNSFTELSAQRQPTEQGVRFVVSDDWLQGRTCYGGLISAFAVQAMRDRAGTAWADDVGLRALQTCFVGPVTPGSLDIDVQLLRQGRNVCQVQAQVRQGDAVAAVMLGVFAADRTSALTPRVPQRPPPRREADDLPAPPQRLPGAPVFLQHFDMRWADGPPPFSGGEGWTTSIHMRLQQAEAATMSNEMQAVLLADLPPTPAVGQLRRPSANSSVSWALELRPTDPAPPTAWWRIDSESLMASGGYVNHAARLWAPSGQLAAFGYQVVAVFT